MSRVFIPVLMLIMGFSTLKAYIPAADIEKEIISTMTQTIRLSYPFVATENITIKVLTKDRLASAIPENTASFEIKVNKTYALLGRVLVRISFFNENKDYIRQHSAYVEAQALADFFYSKQLIYKGESIKEESIYTEQGMVMGKPKNAVVTKGDILGKEAAYTINKDAIIVDWMIKKIPAVREGDEIAAIYNKHNIVLGLEAFAIDNGGIGDKIRVQITSTKKIVSAEIISSKSVRISE